MEKKYNGLTGHLLGDVLYLLCMIVMTVIAITGILHHGSEWGLYVLLWVAAGEAYTARLHANWLRRHEESK